MTMISATVSNDLKNRLSSEAERRKRTEASLIRKILYENLEEDKQ